MPIIQKRIHSMPEYDFRCNACAQQFTLRFKTYAMVDDAAPLCPACNSADLSRLIARVAIAKANRDYSKLSSREMLSVLESGEKESVDEMFKQVGGSRDDKAAPGSAPVDAD